jgi:hypothetical protein
LGYLLKRRPFWETGWGEEADVREEVSI